MATSIERGSHPSSQGTPDNTNNADFSTKDERNTELIKFVEVVDTPFTIAIEEKRSTVLLGKYKMSEHETEKEAFEEAKRISWNKIVSVIAIILTSKEII